MFIIKIPVKKKFDSCHTCGRGGHERETLEAYGGSDGVPFVFASEEGAQKFADRWLTRYGVSKGKFEIVKI